MYYHGNQTLATLLYTPQLNKFYSSADKHLLYNIIVTHSFGELLDNVFMQHVPRTKKNPQNDVNAFLEKNRIFVAIVNLASGQQPEDVAQAYAAKSTAYKSIIRQYKSKISGYDLNIIHTSDMYRCLPAFLNKLGNISYLCVLLMPSTDKSE